MLTAVNKLTLLLEPPSVAVDVKIGGVTTFDGPDGVVGHKVALMTPMIVFASVRNRHPLPQRHHHPLPAYSTTFTTSVRPLHKSYSCYGGCASLFTTNVPVTESCLPFFPHLRLTHRRSIQVEARTSAQLAHHGVRR
jgi:hypothetical protein